MQCLYVFSFLLFSSINEESYLIWTEVYIVLSIPLYEQKWRCDQRLEVNSPWNRYLSVYVYSNSLLSKKKCLYLWHHKRGTLIDHPDPDFNFPDLFLFSYLKSKMYDINPWTTDEFKANTRSEIIAISSQMCGRQPVYLTLVDVFLVIFSSFFQLEHLTSPPRWTSIVTDLLLTLWWFSYTTTNSKSTGITNIQQNYVNAISILTFIGIGTRV